MPGADRRETEEDHGRDGLRLENDAVRHRLHAEDADAISDAGLRTPDVVLLRANTRQNGVAGMTRNQRETTNCMTPSNLQNLDPRFKSGRRLQFSSSNSTDCASAAQVGARNWTTVDYKS